MTAVGNSWPAYSGIPPLHSCRPCMTGLRRPSLAAWTSSGWTEVGQFGKWETSWPSPTGQSEWTDSPAVHSLDRIARSSTQPQIYLLPATSLLMFWMNFKEVRTQLLLKPALLKTIAQLCNLSKSVIHTYRKALAGAGCQLANWTGVTFNETREAAFNRYSSLFWDWYFF